MEIEQFNRICDTLHATTFSHLSKEKFNLTLDAASLVHFSIGRLPREEVSLVGPALMRTFAYLIRAAGLSTEDVQTLCRILAETQEGKNDAFPNH